MSDPKLEAIQSLLSFLMQSEAKRAMPQEEPAAPALDPMAMGDKKEERRGGDELPDDIMQGLSRIKDEDEDDQEC